MPLGQQQTRVERRVEHQLPSESAARLALHQADGKFPQFLIDHTERAQQEILVVLSRLGLAARQGLVVGLLEGLVDKLSDLSIRSLITIFQARREEVSPPSYADFDHAVGDPQYRARILQELPELNRLMTLAHSLWLRHCTWILDTLAADMPRLERRWGVSGEVVQIQLGEGDTHRLGQSVCFVDWENGTRLVLKPSSGEIRGVLDELLKTLDSDRSWFGRLLPESLLDDQREWQLFEVPSTFTPESASQYFRRYGRASALLFALGANDLHRENVIATVEGPLLVDTETLTSIPPVPPADSTTAHEMLAHDDERSILRTLLYPARYLGARVTVDLSALGVPSKAASVSEGIAIVNEGTNDIRFTQTTVPLPRDANRVLDDQGRHLDPRQYSEEILRGFHEAFHKLQRSSDVLDAALERAGSFGFRHVFRATWLYARLLEVSTHPSRLEDNAARSSTLDLLAAPAKGRRESLRQKIRRAEIEALENLDIPYFEVAADGRLYANNGTALGTLGEDPRQIIRRWWHDTLGRPVEEQLRRIRLSLDAAADDAISSPHESFRPRSLNGDLSGVAHPPAEVLSADGAFSTWLTSVQFEQGLYLTPLTLSLYEGGGTLITEWETHHLDHPTERQGTSVCEKLGRLLAGATFHSIPTEQISPKEIIYSAWTGALSDAVTEIELSIRAVPTTGRAENQLQAAFGVLPELLASLGEAHTGEMLNGTGGTFTALNRYRDRWWSASLSSAEAERLISQFSAVADRLTTVLNAPESGWAHGNIGRLLGLSECLDLIRWATGQRLQDCADILEAHLHSTLESMAEDTSLRDPLTVQTWCRGAAGAAPAILRVVQLLSDESASDDPVHAAWSHKGSAESGVNAVWPLIESLLQADTETYPDLSLCHGAAGPVLSLALLGKALDRADLIAAAGARRDAFLRRAQQHGWSSGLGRSPSAEGFFVGRAGWDLVSTSLDRIDDDGDPTRSALPRMIGGP